VTADLLQPEHHPGQFIGTSFSAPAELAYFPILTEYTPQIAVGQKDRPGAAFSNQWSFFAKMRMRR
jgi:hypothetical protein